MIYLCQVTNEIALKKRLKNVTSCLRPERQVKTLTACFVSFPLSDYDDFGYGDVGLTPGNVIT